jgi:Zn-finger nucleic acid-binding protein
MTMASSGGEKVMQCPRCLTKLHKQSHARAVIDHCESCAGSFFDEGEMLKVLGKSADPEVWARANRTRTPCASELSCPRCFMRMHMHPLAHKQGGESIDVDVDFCPGCGGIWLDGGEVDSVMQIGARNLGADASKKAAHAGAERAAQGATQTATERGIKRAGAADPADAAPGEAGGSGPEMLKEFLSLFPKAK